MITDLQVLLKSLDGAIYNTSVSKNAESLIRKPIHVSFFAKILGLQTLHIKSKQTSLTLICKCWCHLIGLDFKIIKQMFALCMTYPSKLSRNKLKLSRNKLMCNGCLENSTSIYFDILVYNWNILNVKHNKRK